MLEPDAIMADEDLAGRTPRLEIAKDHIIRSTVVLKYVLMDEFLSAIVCWRYFGKRRSFPQCGRPSVSGRSTTSYSKGSTFFKSWISSGAFTTSRSRWWLISLR
jgi:hypothetical protein